MRLTLDEPVVKAAADGKPTSALHAGLYGGATGAVAGAAGLATIAGFASLLQKNRSLKRTLSAMKDGAITGGLLGGVLVGGGASALVSNNNRRLAEK